MFRNKTQFKKGDQRLLGNKYRVGKIPWNKGIKTGANPEHSKRMKGVVPWNKGTHGIMKAWNKGKTDIYSKDTLEKMRMNRNPKRGENHYRWIKDRTKVIKTDRNFHDPEYKQWRKSVCNRDGWKCKINNLQCNGRLEVHHILGWKNYPNLRYEVNNGITLCHFHHPRKIKDEMRLSPYFQELIKV